MRSTLIKKLSRATASAVTVLGISAGCITMVGTSAYAAAPAAVTPAKSTAAKVSIVVASSANPAAPGQTVTFTTTLKGSSSKLPVPTGTVVFVIDGDTLPAVALSGGTASYTWPPLDIGPGYHSVYIDYSGDGVYPATESTKQFVQYVQYPSNYLETRVKLTLSKDKVAPGQVVTVIATVSAVESHQGTPTGTLQFTIGGSPLTEQLVDGVAEFSVSVWQPAAYTVITADYLGGGIYAPSSAKPATIQTKK
jgi:Bacterial Ig-like domain (group 3)